MGRQRLTITLDQKVLKNLDLVIDGSKIRNRSHAIEFILNSHLAPKVTQALILAGGCGLKLRPFTYEMPKCMLPVKGRPLLEHAIELFRKHEVRNLIISVGYLGDKIKEYFGDGSKFGVRITYIEQGSFETGTAMPVKQAEKLLKNETFILYYGDVLADINLLDLINFHIENSGMATLALTTTANPADWGVVSMHGTKILNFTEKPKVAEAKSHLINSGIIVVDPAVFQYITERDKKLENDVFPKLAKQGKLFGYLFEGKWFDISSPENYEKALKDWK